jgi:hypothetical protein
MALILSGGDGGNATITGNSANLSISNAGNVLASSATISASGNVTGGNVLTAGLITATGNITSGNVLDSKGEIRTVPINSQTTGYTLVAADLGKFISTNANVTIPASVFSSGQSILVYNNSANNITLLQAANTTVQLAGTATTGNRTLAQCGLSTIFCVAANTFVTSGSGLT